ncbi:unnamed protein product [Symbiodinium sp. CCMP2592]|nr:unnamed protein product [Symbiodinium sp. CCMP2592]
MEAITFVHFTFDILILHASVKSKRCWGLSSAKQATLASKADPFTVEEILEMHRILYEGDDLWDRLMCGVSLFCIYARCRWSDFQHVDSLSLECNDQGFAEFGSAFIDVHKTMNFSSKLPKCLELVAVGRGLDGKDWLCVFMEVRKALGVEYHKGYPSMPAPDKSGAPTVRALGSDEAGAWLRELLPGREGRRTTSHSLKATLLSFAAKRGLAHTDRLALGGHFHGAHMADVYARDALARPLRLLAGMLSEIRLGKFAPDAGRAARFPGRTNEELIGAELPTGVAHAAPTEPQPLGEVHLGSSNRDSSARGLESFSQWDLVSLGAPSHASKAVKSDACTSQAGGEVMSVKSDRTEPPSPDFSEGVGDLSLMPDRAPQGSFEIVPDDISEVNPDDGVSSDGDTSSEGSSSESSDSSEGENPEPRLMPPPSPPEGTFFMQHRKLKTLHLLLTGHRSFTLCGRPLQTIDSPFIEPGRLRTDKPIVLRVAMTLVDSEAAFAARCKEICGDDSLHTLLQASGVQTHSALAFSCGTPKAQPTEAEFKAFAESVVGSPASIGRVSQLKRLHFESSTLVIAQLRALVEGDSTDAGKRLPAAEKSARLADAKRRLKGLVIEDEMEPSHALIDAVSHMGESNAVVWIPPSKCTKRDAELKLGLRDKQKYLTVQEQSVTLAPAPDKIVAEHGTPLEVQWCLQRRGLAFFMCGFMEWETHEKWVASLLRCLSSDVPPGYAPISMQQILRADSEIFLLLAREVKRVKPDSSGVMEMDVLMNRHRDLRNLPGSLNGVDLLVSAGPVTFDATVEHETLDWTNGGTDAPASVPALSHTTTAASDTVSGVIIDVFAGDAAFCKAAHKAGFRALAFDLKPQRAQFPIQPLDITQADELAVLREVISEHAGATSLVQFTVPCLSTFFTSKTGSWSFAELLVDAVFQLCSHCRAVGVPFAILHPATSRFWHMPSCQRFFQAADGEWTTFDQCMHGGAQVADVLSSPWTWSTKHGPHDAHKPTKDFSDVCGLLPPTEHSPVLEVVWIGIPREPDDFLRRAVAAGHPKSLLDVEADPHMTLLIDNLLNSSVKQPDKGLHEVQRWTELRSDLSESQDLCKKEWPIHVAQVLDAKPTLLMDELLTQHDFPDRHLVKHMTQGFRLTGWVCRSGLFPFDPKPPASTLKSQLSMAKSRNTATLTKLSKQAPDEVSRRAWAETLEEVDKGWIEEDENPDLSTVLVAKRFGLLQGPKVRVIDDCRACAFNLLAGIPEKYRLQSVEYIAAFLLRAMLDPRSKGVSISGKTLDLTAAYKQYATHPFDRDLLRIGVKDTSSGDEEPMPRRRFGCQTEIHIQDSQTIAWIIGLIFVPNHKPEVASDRKKDTRFTVDEHSGKLKANLVDYTLMQQWSDRIIRARMDEPSPQYGKPSWSQLVAADKKLFSELRDLTRDGVQSSGGGRPLDKHLPIVMASYDVERPGPYSPSGADKKGSDGARISTQLQQRAGREPRAVFTVPERRTMLPALGDAGPQISGNGLVPLDRQREGTDQYAANQPFVVSAPERPTPSRAGTADLRMPAADNPFNILLRCLSFFDHLPNDTVGVGVQSTRDQVGKSFYAGMYSHGVVGLRASVRKFPDAIRSFAALIRVVCPSQLFTSLVILEDSRLEPHRDASNACCHNLIIPLTRFEGGELLLEDSVGAVRRVGQSQFRSRAISLDQGPIAFDARRLLHAVNPAKGRRVVLIAYCLKGVARLPESDLCALRELGFNLPSQEPAEADLAPTKIGLPAIKGKPLLCVELFAGTGDLSSCLRSVGFKVLAADRGDCRLRGGLHIVRLDLCKSLSWQYLRRLAQAGDVFLVHLQPPRAFTQDPALVSELVSLCRWLRDLQPAAHFAILDRAVSPLWKHPTMTALAGLCPQISFDACAHGGDQPECMLLWTTAAKCDGHHSHKSCRNGSQASRLHSSLFCQRFAASVALTAGQKDVAPAELDLSNATARAATHRQPKVSRAVVLVDEYHYQVGANKVTSVTCGVYRTPLQFASCALRLCHPFDMCRALPDQALRVLAQVLMEGPVAVLRRRLDVMTRWKSWAAELEKQEADLHKSLRPTVAGVSKGKRLLLLDRIAKSLDWPDLHLHEDLVHGFRIVGDERPSGVFPFEPNAASLTVDELVDQSRLTKHLIWSQIRDAPLDQTSQQLFDITEAEHLEKSWLGPPRSWEQLEAEFGDWLPVKRFGVSQKDKLRPIDDLAANGVNSAFGAADKMTLRAFDELVWSASFIMRALLQKGCVEVILSDGQRIAGPLHDSWKASPDSARPKLKTVDLKAAYKQLPLHPNDQRVNAFNRVARLLQRIMQEALVMNFNYFDDYPLLEMSCLTNSCDKIVHSILSLLGFDYASEKENEFDVKADLLGVTVDLGDENLTEVRVANRESKCAEVAAAVGEVLSRGSLRSAEVASLFGRIQFMEGQLLGRMGRLALSELRSLGLSSGFLKLGAVERRSFENLRDRMLAGPPRAICTRPPGHNVLVFTEGACEPEGDSMRCSIGWVMYVESSGKWTTRYFSCSLPDELIRRWGAGGKKHLIGPVELFAVVTARVVWREFLDGARTLFFIDHSGVHAACVNGSSHDGLRRELLVQLEMADAVPLIGWYARVPSFSNPADAPSRGSSEFPVWGTLLRDHPHCCISNVPLSPLGEKGD